MTMPASGQIDVHPPPLHSELTVADLSAVGDEVWAVGMRGAPAPARIAHTAGGEPWQLVSYSSSSEAEHTQLSGVHATASDDVWAVGHEGLPLSDTKRTHIAHGDGTTWRPVESPDFGDGSHLSDVAAWGRDDAFAVGSRTSHPSLSSGPLGLPPVAAHDTLAVRWDGARWATVPSPGRGVFGAVCAVGPGAYWAVGATALAERSGNVALVAHYAGGQWQQVGSEGTGALLDVAATGPDDVWAVGQNQAPGHLDDPLILHYDGHAWAPTGVPEIAGQASLIAIACAGRDNVWAVGFQDPEDGPFGPFILHFDGSSWAAVEPPATAAPTSLQAVTTLPGGAAWVAGFVSSTPGDTGYTVPLVMSTRGNH
jgi:hypothetical protein